MSLHVETHGTGRPLLLLHGWGMHGGMWGPVVPQLAQRFQVHVADLPGHGHSRIQDSGFRIQDSGFRIQDSGFGIQGGLDALVSELDARFDGPLDVCGWSLGGMVAQRWAARAPDKVRRLVLVASTPCFTGREDWPFGMAADVLQQFAADLEQNHAATLRRFIALQVRGSENERELLQRLREALFDRGEPALAALRGGLGILRDADLRAELSVLRQPVLLIAGGRDRLTPAAASHYMAQAMPDARVLEIGGAAHAPFLSHTQTVVERMVDFLHE